MACALCLWLCLCQAPAAPAGLCVIWVSRGPGSPAARTPAACYLPGSPTGWKPSIKLRQMAVSYRLTHMPSAGVVPWSPTRRPGSCWRTGATAGHLRRQRGPSVSLSCVFRERETACPERRSGLRRQSQLTAEGKGPLGDGAHPARPARWSESRVRLRRGLWCVCRCLPPLGQPALPLSLPLLSPPSLRPAG